MNKNLLIPFIIIYCIVAGAILGSAFQIYNLSKANIQLTKEVKQNFDEIEIWKKKTRVLERKLKNITHKEVTVTSYTDQAEPNITACRTKPRPGTIAVSQDLFLMGWTCGKKVDLAGVGIVTINDKMHPRKKKQVDLFLPSRYAALQFGIKRNRKAILLLNI